MKNIRIIPRLEVKGPNLVKGIQLEGLRVLGKPHDFALKYYDDGADELLYLDIVASLYGRNNLSDIVKMTAGNVFIPLTVGGGIRTIEDIRGLLRVGADKIAINSAVITNPGLIKEAAKTFGSQCIVVSIEAKKIEHNRYEAYIYSGRERTGLDVFDWAKKAVDLGAGEILITSIDNEGTGKGFDIELTHKIAEITPVPVIACGGAGRKEDILQVINECKIDGVAISSSFHYNRLQELDFKVDLESEFSDEGNVEFLKRSKMFLSDRITPMKIPALKSYLLENGIACRTEQELKGEFKNAR